MEKIKRDKGEIMKIITINPLIGGSDKYGSCEACGKFVASIYIARFDINEIETIKSKRVFGHKECIKGVKNGG